MILKFNTISEGFEQVKKIVVATAKGADDSAKEIAQKHSFNLQYAMLSKNLVHTRETIRSIRWTNPKEHNYNVEILSKAFAIDSMTPHAVKLLKSRQIYKWAMDKGNRSVVEAALAQRSIWVHPHPFLQETTQKTLRRVSEIVNRNIDIAVRNA